MSNTKIEIGEERFIVALYRTINETIKQIVEEEAEAAALRVRQRISEKADSVALKLLTEYDIQKDMNRIVISVHKTGELASRRKPFSEIPDPTDDELDAFIRVRYPNLRLSTLLPSSKERWILAYRLEQMEKGDKI